MNKKHEPEKNKKLKLMARLQYGENYSGLLYLCVLLTVFVLILRGMIALIIPPLFFFYLALVQFYSGIGFDVLGLFLSRRYDPKLIAKHKREKESILFYFSIGYCLVIGIVMSVGLFIANNTFEWGIRF